MTPRVRRHEVLRLSEHKGDVEIYLSSTGSRKRKAGHVGLCGRALAGQAKGVKQHGWHAWNTDPGRRVQAVSASSLE